jgi:hypothetical protein
MKNLTITNILFALVLISLSATLATAQPGGGPPPPGEKREEIEAMKVAFLTRKLDLTPDEAKIFWPEYNQYQNELEKIREEHRKQRKSARDEMENMQDKEVEKIVDGEIAFRQSELDILKKYNTRFKSVLPMKKVARLYRAEEDFKRELLQRIQERRKEGHPGSPGDKRR